MKDDKYVTIKVLKEARQLLRLIAAQTGEQMAQVVIRLVRAEWDRVRTHEDDKPGKERP